MLKKENRLKNSKAFSATYHLHKVISNEKFILYQGKFKQDEEMPTKIGFVVSKKYHKRAVKRNRIKRLLREVLRLAIKNKTYPNINKYLSLIFTVKQNADELSFEEVKKYTENLLEKI